MSGSYGLRSVPWRNVERTLRTFGAEPYRTESKHGNMRWRLPDSTIVTVKPPTRRMKEAKFGSIKRVLSDLENAGIAPELFLAVLDDKNCSWFKKPEAIPILKEHLAKGAYDLSVPEEWRRVMADHQKQNYVPDTPESAGAGTPEELRHYDDTAAKPLNLDEVLELCQLPADVVHNARAYANRATRNRIGLFGKLMDQGKIWRVPGPSGKRKRSWFTPSGAIAVAELLEQRYAPDPETDEARHKRLRASVQVPPPLPAPAQGEAHGEALIRLARHHGVEVVWEEFTIDVGRTIQRIVSTLEE